MVALIWFIVIFFILLIYWFAAKEFAQFAADKGYTDKKYFWWCFWLPVIGYTMVIAMPNRNSTTQAVTFDELPGL